MSGIIVPGGAGVWVRPFPGGIARPIPVPGTGTRPMPGGTVDIGPVIGPTTQPADIVTQSQTKGDTMTKPSEMARDLTEDNNNKRKKDCRCEASFTCKGSVSMKDRSDYGLEYQLYVANLRSAPILFTAAQLPPKLTGPAKGGKVKVRHMVTEWKFGGYDEWDGFWLSGCTLIEAKGFYGFMFDIPGRRYEKQVKEWLEKQISTQHAVIRRYQKPAKGGMAVKGQWHFQNKKEYEEFKKLARIQIPIMKKDGFTFHHTPYETVKERKKREEQEQKEFKDFCKDNPSLCT